MGIANHQPMTIVTASLDRIGEYSKRSPCISKLSDMQNTEIRSDLDIIMSGYVSWVGRSSSEVTLKLEQKHSDSDLRYSLNLLQPESHLF